MNNKNLPQKFKKCKAYSVIIEFEVQAITCPGVWLCPNGKVTIQIYLLGLCGKTTSVNPVFPIEINEKFIFRKNITHVETLCDIDKKLEKEVVYIEFVQWENSNIGNVLATFKTSLKELLYPSTKKCKGLFAGVDVDLLMEATKIYPGIISPKIEVSTKFSIEEVLCSLKTKKENDILVINPKLISSKCIPKRPAPIHQRKVCHTRSAEKSVMPKIPRKIVFNKNSKSLKKCSSAKCNNLKCICTEDEDKREENHEDNFIYNKIKQIRCECACKSLNLICLNNVHRSGAYCNLCTKYNNYFPSSCDNICVHQDYCCTIREENNRNNLFPVYFYKENKAVETDEVEINMEPSKYEQVTVSRGCSAINLCNSEVNSNGIQKCSCVVNDLCEKSPRDEFYEKLEKFYKHLYIRAHQKTKSEHCICHLKEENY